MEVGWEEIQAALPTLQPVTGGFTAARRGIISLASGKRAFVKLAVDEQTTNWINQEKKAYKWLMAQGYRYAPIIMAEGPDGFALPDLSHLDWSNTWSDKKLGAVFTAMDSLAELSDQPQNSFDHFKEFNAWDKVPVQPHAYRRLTNDQALLQKLTPLLTGKKRLILTSLAETHPEEGNRLIHLDVRADNFCFDKESGQGYLVDWNWLALGSEVFDVNALLVSVHKSGFSVLDFCPNRLDKTSLACLIGFWLAQAALPIDKKTEHLRQHQFNSALTALELYEAIHV